MNLNNAEVLAFKKPFLTNTSIRATLNPKPDAEPPRNFPHALPKTPKQKSISIIHNKNIQSFSTSALPCYQRGEQVNNCEAVTSTMNKNIRNFDGFSNSNQVSAEFLGGKGKGELARDYHTPKFRRDNNLASQFQMPMHNKSSTQLNANILNLRQTTYGDSAAFIPKHKHPEWLQKMQAYSKAMKSPKINAMDKKNQDRDKEKQVEITMPSFQQLPESPRKGSHEQKLFFRQTLDPQMDRNFVDSGVGYGARNLSPLNFRKKAVNDKNDRDLSANKVDRMLKNQSKNATHQAITQQGSFWRNKAVSPPSKPWSPLKLDNASKQIKVPPLPISSHEKATHKPSFFMSKKSLNRFSIMKQLGSGTLSDAFLCMDKKSSALFCLKRYHKATMKSLPQVLDNFIKKIAFQLLAEDPNIVQLYDIFSDGEFIFTVQQYMQGGKLSESLQREIDQRELKRRETQNFTLAQIHKEPEEPLFNESRIIDKIYDINSALCYVHQSGQRAGRRRMAGLVHGDVRTKSILVCMGVCKLPAIEPANVKSYYINSFSPPQQIIQQVYIPKSDIWNLGLILFQLCAERKLFGHPEPHTPQHEDLKPGYQVFNVNITEQIDKLIGTTQMLKDLMKKLLAIQPEDRPTSDKVMECNVFKMYGFDVEWKERRNQKVCKGSREIGKEREVGKEKEKEKKHTISLQQLKSDPLIAESNRENGKRQSDLGSGKQSRTKGAMNSHNNSFNINLNLSRQYSNLNHTHDSAELEPTATKPHWIKSRVSLQKKY